MRGKGFLFAVATGLLLTGLVVLLAQQPPEEPARLLEKLFPTRPMLYLQVKDAAGLIQRYRQSVSRSRYEQGQSFATFQKSRLYVKLEERIKRLAETAGFEINLEHVASFSGRPSAFWLFDLAELKFVAATVLDKDQFAASILSKVQPDFEERQEDQEEKIRYWVRENPEAGVVLAWTRVNNCLVFCHNAVPEFLAIARHLSQNNDFCSQSEEIFRKVFHANFSSHQATLFLTGSALQNTYFRSYWLFRNEPEWRWMELGLVDFEERPDEWVERRYFLSGNSVIKGERTDLDQLACFVPETAYVNLCAEKDAEKLAEKLERYLFPEEMGKEIKGKMVSLLAAGQPDSYGVVLEPFFEADFFLRWKRALLLHLTRPEKFNRAEFLKVTREIYGQSFFPGGSSPASFDWKKSALSGKEVYLLEPPLFPGSSLAMAAVGPVLFLANSGDFLQKMVNSSGQKWEIDPGSFHLIRADGQKLWNSYQKTISFLASSPDWSTQEAATFFQENIPSLAVWFEPVKGFFFEERVRENCLEQVVRYRLR